MEKQVQPKLGKMSDKKRKTIYGMATQLGLYDKHNKDDNLHAIVLRLTGKESISQLTEEEGGLVVNELIKLKGRGGRVTKTTRGKSPEESLKGHRPGMISLDMQKTVWFYMYRLEELDKKPSQISLGKRLCALIKKYLHVDAVERDPMRFVSFKGGRTLIEVLKKIVEHEKQKQKG